jgi:hypothetical protein
MNQFFSLRRFGRFVAYDLKTNYKQYFIAAMILFAAAFVITYLEIDEYDIKGQDNLFYEYFNSFIICFVGFVVFAGLSFPAFSSKKNTISYLMLPASVFEKYSAEFILRIICGGILFLLIFWLSANCAAEAKCLFYNFENHTNYSVSNLSFIKLIKNIFYIKIHHDFYNWRRITSNDLSAKIFCATIIIFVFSVRLFFKRFALVKTVAAGIGIVLILIWAISTFATDFMDKYFLQNDLQGVVFFDYISILFTILCITLLLTGYYKLKEKKI